MPEGDTIFRTAMTLRRWLGGRQITAARSAVTGVAAELVVGRTVEAVDARAKHLLIRLDGGLVLHSHMRMTGSWHVYPTGEPWRVPARQARLVVEAGDRLAVCFNAPVVELLSAAETRVHPVLRRLGPDVLGPDPPDPVEVHGRAEGRAGQVRTIGELLLDQAVVSGIGNIYRCESLFLCGVHPARPLPKLAAGELDRLVATASRLMRASVTTGRPVARSLSSPSGQHWVYRRAGRPCRRCGTLIRRSVLGRQPRSVYWCPTCQPLADDGPALTSALAPDGADPH